MQWPVPEDAGELSSFLGLASYYRRFVPGFATLAGPLHALVGSSRKKAGKRSKSDFVWTSESDESFQKLKTLLSTAPVLAYPKFGSEFVLEVDASLKGLGACLLQANDDGKLHPIAYASRGLRGAERNYPDFSSFKIELLALKWAVTEKFKEYLMGSHCKVYTDNNPLSHLQTAQLGATEQRWAAQLASFDIEILYKPGKLNTCADALSRHPNNQEEGESCPAELQLLLVPISC
ncbi:putative transposon Ty3-I Gag-Pol polyprotein [Apostichopus japonicus]|uniref:Putative transposon Ty3-I Gag-Pol polyprotein n=1 Tax=Stichopus japonicus TaxID=307972 RepID=A0A2G8KFW9_STIJA|nr:putative transposon Ty3-I Gag-Pol polyprotein [Apostichopus japonicus]